MSASTRKDSFDRAVASNGAALLGYFQRRMSNPADAAEAFGEMLLVAWRSRRRMPVDDDKARMWLYGVARNVLRNANRSLARRSAAVQQFKNHQLTVHALHEPDPLHDEIREAIAALSVEDSELVRLVYWDGLPSHEAAQLLGINPSTARSRLSKAREAIRVFMDPSSLAAGKTNA